MSRDINKPEYRYSGHGAHATPFANADNSGTVSYQELVLFRNAFRNIISNIVYDKNTGKEVSFIDLYKLTDNFNAICPNYGI